MRKQSALSKDQKRVQDAIPEARYAYYRRCQVFRKGGEQCKAPAETGSLICHAHAGQLAMAVRRERERRAVLEEAVAEMRGGAILNAKWRTCSWILRAFR